MVNRRDSEIESKYKCDCGLSPISRFSGRPSIPFYFGVCVNEISFDQIRNSDWAIMQAKHTFNLIKPLCDLFADGLPVSFDGNAGSRLPRYFNGSPADSSATVSLQTAGSVQGLQVWTHYTVCLPVGVELDDIRVVGHDLVIEMPDGTEIVIPDGAASIPQIVIGGVAVPPANLAAVSTLNATIERALASKGNP